MAEFKTPIGIDLGTTFSAIAHLDNEGRPCTIPNSEGELTTPSVVFFDHDAVIVGTEAAYAGESDMDRLARAAKRDMGGTRYRKTIRGRYLPPEVIQSYVLQKLKNDAELKVGPITQAVITVPAYFNEPRRKSTQDAGELAGLDVIDIINEPTAAALAFGVQSGFLNEKGTALERELILVYDLGGGTFDVTLMEIDDSQFNAIATAGDVYLGGIDWDKRIYDFAREEIEKEHDVDFESDPVLKEKLLSQCVRAKRALSARTATAIRLEHEGARYKVDITREKFEELTRDLLERTRLTTDLLLRDAGKQWSDLTRLLLVGGSTRMPMVLNLLEKHSGLKIDRSLSPDESVAHGAAIYAGILMKHGASIGKGISVTNVNSHDLGVMGIDPKTRAPKRQIVIPKNHKLPAKAAKRFQTSKDGQRKIVVQVVEGGTDDGQGATTIGKCVVTDLPEDIKKGTPLVVGFSYLSSGRLKVKAQLPTYDITEDIEIERSAGMTQEELDSWKKKMASGVAFLDDEPIVKPKKKTKARESKPQADSPSPKKSRPAKADSAASPKKSDAKKRVAKKKKVEEPAVEEPIVPVLGEAPKSAVEVDAFVLDDVVEQVRVEEDSAIFAFDDDANKPAVGESVLDFLSGEVEKKSSADDSALDEFFKDLG